jgi:hypothetical protein
MPKGPGTYGSKVGRPPKKKYDEGGVVTISIIPMSRKMDDDLIDADDDLIDATDVISLEGRDAMFIKGNEAMFDEPEKKKKKKVKKKKDGGMIKYGHGGEVSSGQGCGMATSGRKFSGTY